MTFSFAGVRPCDRWNSRCGDGGNRHEFSFRIHDMKSANDKGQVGAEYQGTLEEVWRIRGDTQRRLLGRHLLGRWRPSNRLWVSPRIRQTSSRVPWYSAPTCPLSLADFISCIRKENSCRLPPSPHREFQRSH